MRTFLIATGIYEPDIGGPAAYLARSAPFLSQNNKVTVVTYSSVRHFDNDAGRTWRVIRIWRRWPKLIRHFLYAWRVYKEARHADVLYGLSATNAGLAVWFAGLLFRKKYVVRVVGDYAWERAAGTRRTQYLIDEFQKNRKGLAIRFLHCVQLFVCRRAANIIVPSAYLAQLVTNWGVPRGKISVVNNGIESHDVLLTKEDARRGTRLAGVVLLSIGRMVPWKGHRMLVKIMPQLLKINPYFQLVLIGSGPDFSVLQGMIKNGGLQKQVFLYEAMSRTELNRYLAAADIFIQNTGYEGFSHQLLEAMSVGLPVITTNVCGNPEIVTQGENGFLIDYNDDFNLIEAIKTLWRSEAMREKFIKAGRIVAARYTIEQMCQETLRILEAQKLK